MREVTELFRDLIQSLDVSLEVKNINTANNKTYYYVCDTKWASIGKKLFLQNENNPSVYDGHTMIQVDTDGVIVIEGNHTNKNIRLNLPFNISGTKISTNNEWNNVSNDLRDKTPLCWLYSNYRENIYGDEASLERSITMNIAFLDETNPLFQTNNEHIVFSVIPMKKLAMEFIKSINKNAIYKKLNQFTLNTYSRFGVESENGVIQNILDANLSGVVLNVTIDKFKEPCKC